MSLELEALLIAIMATGLFVVVIGIDYYNTSSRSWKDRLKG